MTTRKENTKTKTITVRRSSDNKYAGRIVPVGNKYQCVMHGYVYSKRFSTVEQAADFMAQELNFNIDYYC